MTTLSSPAAGTPDGQRWAWLPRQGTWKYHALLGALGILVLGPLGGVTAAYMNFAVGFFVGGQVLAGLLGSVVTFGYGAEGKHGANFIQTAAASVASMSAMCVLIQAMVWMGLPQPPVWQLMLYMLCIGMFGAGVGMLYTPIVVDRLQLTFPSGLAVANILRALTDPRLLRQSVGRLGGGIALGLAGGIGAAKIAAVAALELSTSTLGAGLVVGARIGIPAVVAGLTGLALSPYFLSIGWLHEGDPPRKIMFLIALGTIMGAALIDISLILREAVQRLQGRAPAREAAPQQDWQRIRMGRVLAWVAFWGIGVALCGHFVLGQPFKYLLIAIALVFVFGLVNGIALGISDSTPISSAFVVAVVIMASVGLKDPVIGLMAGAVLLTAVAVAGDMQQDRSTGWRLGTNRALQFRYQVLGILVGAVLAVGFARLFMAAYPVLQLDQTIMKGSEQPANWSAAMTYKLVGVLRSLTEDKPYQRTAIWIGVGLGFGVELLRKIIKSRAGYQRFVAGGKLGQSTDFLLDAVVLPSPYAWSFGGFLNLSTSVWFGLGGVISSLINALPQKKPAPGEEELPADMSSTSLIGGGLIAGDALAALGLGVIGLLATLAG
ncbi:OPT/YSL family transporter [Ideonella sp. B7]|uniref:OPT/YSL family transporter n=1 Tax=Ideonella benzenivorans TaxID=2831643 RepID=UPI001CED5E88|nr:OPT/YSL family transporter [Ideonella benzenivorans]MCA6216590.1 OPT/YSL family transporter [Ideonella benzenivorans]